jgi:hypothetical protein
MLMVAEAKVIDLRSVPKHVTWVDPSKEVCIKHKGSFENNICKATWDGAMAICESIGKNLGSFDNYKNMIATCGEEMNNVSDENIKAYQTCMLENNFQIDGYYWTLEKETSDDSWRWFVPIRTGYANTLPKNRSMIVRCVE